MDATFGVFQARGTDMQNSIGNYNVVLGLFLNCKLVGEGVETGLKSRLRADL